MKNEVYPEEFKVIITKHLSYEHRNAIQKELNKQVYEFKKENPEYELFDISYVKTGTVQVKLILTWRKI